MAVAGVGVVEAGRQGVPRTGFPTRGPEGAAMAEMAPAMTVVVVVALDIVAVVAPTPTVAGARAALPYWGTPIPYPHAAVAAAAADVAAVASSRAARYVGPATGMDGSTSRPWAPHHSRYEYPARHSGPPASRPPISPTSVAAS